MRPKVLIVDDDVQTLTALKRLLKPNFEVEGYSDPEAATSFVREGMFDVALIDVQMPSIDGFTLLDELRRHRPQVPVAMLSGDARPEVVVEAMRHGASDFVAKPFDDARGLANRLNSVLVQARSRSGIDALLSQLEDDNEPLPRYTDARQTLMTEFQRTYLERLMRDSKGNLSAASRLSGIDRANLRRALQKHKKSR